MSSKALSKFQRFGKVGIIVMTVLTVIAITVTAASLTATIYVATLPKDALTVRVTNDTEFRLNEKKFGSLWSILADGFTYSGTENPKKMLSNEETEIAPSDNSSGSVKLSFFNQSYSFDKIYSEGGTKVMKAKSSPAVYRSADLAVVLVFLTLSAASVTAALYMLRRLFAVLRKCESPFCQELVNKMKAFGFSLLPVAVFSTVSETLSVSFLSAGRNTGISIQWGVLIAFMVTMCLVTVFKLGVQLQKESDETL